MKFGFKFRLAALALAMGLMILVSISSAVKSRTRIAEVRGRLLAVQSESLHIADQFRHSLAELTESFARYRTTRNPEDWERFNKAAGELDTWIDQQTLKLNTAREKEAMRQIDVAYDDYRNATKEIRAKMEAAPDQLLPVSELTTVRKAREHLNELGANLAEAHRARANELLAAGNQSVARLGLLVLISLALLVVFGGGFGVLAYRDLIAPLRIKLVESLALLERQEKLASLGVLAAGVAHEIRNPLTAIKAALFLQMKKAQPGSQDRADLELVGGEITRLEHIVRDFLQFARPSEPQFVLLPADQPLRHVQKLLASQLAKNSIRLVVEDSPLAHIKVDPAQIEQVLLNLVQNAADSIGHDGTITLRARPDSKPLGGRISNVVVLEVADTGQGILPEVEKRLFDPFFSTKSAGTGLGLSIAARIVEKHGGSLQYQTQVNRGTTFGILLPRAET